VLVKGVYPRAAQGWRSVRPFGRRRVWEKTRSWVERVECLHTDLTRGLHGDAGALHSDSSDASGACDPLRERHLLHKGIPCRPGCPEAPGPVTELLTGTGSGLVTCPLSGRAAEGPVTDPGSDHASWRSAKGRVPARLWRSRSSEDMLASLCERKGPSARRREAQEQALGESQSRSQPQSQSGWGLEDEESESQPQSQPQSQSWAQARA